MLENILDSGPDRFLRKQHLLIEDRPTLVSVVLYADDPQAILPYMGIKIYQYQTSEEGARDTLMENSITIGGYAYRLIVEAVQTTINRVNAILVLGTEGFE
jgi:predicted HTH transcriptional regulator